MAKRFTPFLSPANQVLWRAMLQGWGHQADLFFTMAVVFLLVFAVCGLLIGWRADGVERRERESLRRHVQKISLHGRSGSHF